MSYLNDLGTYKFEKALLDKKLSAAFKNRKLPDFWRVGQKVRFITDQDWAWSKGEVAYVVEVRDEYKDKPAHQYQVFFTGRKDGLGGRFWTTPDDVELTEE